MIDVAPMVRGRIEMNVLARVGTLALFGICAATMNACGDRMIDTGPMNYVIGGGPPPDAPTPIRSMSGTETSYPNLGDVPARPTDIPSYESRQAEIKRLSDARADNRAAAKAVGEGHEPVAPLAIPPAPNLKVGGG